MQIKTLVATPQAQAVCTCYERIFGSPDGITRTELDSISAYLPPHPSAELIVLVAVSAHHRASQRCSVDQLDGKQAAVRAQVQHLEALVLQLERMQAAREAVCRVICATAFIAGSVALGLAATDGRHSTVVSTLQGALALVIACSALVWMRR